MGRMNNLQHKTTQFALKSECNMMVGALITKGHKVYSGGYNSNRTKFLGMSDCSQHAEMAAANNFINSVVRRNPKKYRFLREKGKKT